MSFLLVLAALYGLGAAAIIGLIVYWCAIGGARFVPWTLGILHVALLGGMSIAMLIASSRF